MYMYDVPQRRTEVVFLWFCIGTGPPLYAQTFFFFLSIPISIPGSSTFPFLSLSLLYGMHKLPT